MGVKSIGQIVVGNTFLTFEYIGSIISLINLGLRRNQMRVSHESITSIRTMYCRISKNITILNSIVIVELIIF
jgi:hypothetical protein